MKLLNSLFVYPDTKKNNNTCFQTCYQIFISDSSIAFSPQKSYPSCRINGNKIEILLNDQEIVVKNKHDRIEARIIKISDYGYEIDKFVETSHINLKQDVYDWIYFLLSINGSLTTEQLRSYLVK